MPWLQSPQLLREMSRSGSSKHLREEPRFWGPHICGRCLDFKVPNTGESCLNLDLPDTCKKGLVRIYTVGLFSLKHYQKMVSYVACSSGPSFCLFRLFCLCIMGKRHSSMLLNVCSLSFEFLVREALGSFIVWKRGTATDMKHFSQFTSASGFSWL